MRARSAGILVQALLLPGCLHVGGPTEATPVQPPLTVSVTVEYIQPFFCANTVATRCSDAVNFSASWMRAGGGIQMTPDPTNHVWRAVATDVPVNFPPRDNPYSVRIFDPFLEATPSGGFTAQHLTVGSQSVVDILSGGTPLEHGMIYVDANGMGHSPF
jgi:hypothetical protein